MEAANAAQATPIATPCARPREGLPLSPDAKLILRDRREARTAQIPKNPGPYYRYQRPSCQAVPRPYERCNRRGNEQMFRKRAANREPAARDYSLARST